jgi:hypothetical protein
MTFTQRLLRWLGVIILPTAAIGEPAVGITGLQSDVVFFRLLSAFEQRGITASSPKSIKRSSAR